MLINRILNKKIEMIMMMFAIFIFLGCGTMFKSSEGVTPDKITIPKEVSIEIPKILKESEKNQKIMFSKQKEENISEGYMQLKRHTRNIEESQKFMQINLLLAEQIIDEVAKQCQGTNMATTCTIQENTISFVFNDKLIEDIREVLGSNSDNSIEEERDKIYPLGKIEFRQYNKNEIYQYDLKIDTTFLSQTLEDNETTIQTLKWSKDESRVFTYIVIEDKNETSDMAIDYIKKENGEKEMSITDNFNKKEMLDKDTFYLKILDKNDTDETFEINSTIERVGSLDGELYRSKSLSFGQISNEGGYLSISSSYDIRLFREHYLFDGNGNIIASKYCENSLHCDLNDPDTWLDLSSIDINNPVQLVVTGGNLVNGLRYLLFKPSANIEETMSITKENQVSLFGAIVGELYMYENSIYATLFSDEYMNQLDKLIMASLHIEDVNHSSLKRVAKKDKPTLYIY